MNRGYFKVRKGEVGNTVGSQDNKPIKLSKEQAAFVAGFLEGDGCISAKIAPTPHKRTPYRVRVIISFTQHTRNREILERIRSLLGGSLDDYPSKKLSELTIRDRKRVCQILRLIHPYLVTKQRQSELAQEIIRIFNRGKRKVRSYLEPKELLRMVEIAEEIRRLNSNRGNKTIHTIDEVRKALKRRGLVS
jgi:hypothetical protein